MHVLVTCASLPASTGVVHSPRSAGHTITVVAAVGGVVDTVGVMVVMAVAVIQRKMVSKMEKRYGFTLLSLASMLGKTEQTCSGFKCIPVFEKQLESGMFARRKFKLCTRGPLASPHNTVIDADVLADKASVRKIKLLCWRGGRVMIRRCQAESVAKQHVHLRADLVNGRL